MVWKEMQQVSPHVVGIGAAGHDSPLGAAPMYLVPLLVVVLDVKQDFGLKMSPGHRTIWLKQISRTVSGRTGANNGRRRLEFSHFPRVRNLQDSK